MQSLVFKTLAFADQSNKWVKVISSTVSLNWGKCPKYTKWNIIQLKLAKEKEIATNEINRILLKNFRFFQGQCLLIECINE